MAMPVGRLVMGVALLGLGACKDDPAAAGSGRKSEAGTEDPAAERKRSCEGFATDMARTGLIAGQVLVTALDDDPGSASRGRDELKAGAKGMQRELFDKCMQWPEDVMRCLPPLGILKAGCEERLLAAMEGAAPPPKDVPAGPQPAWTFTLDSDPRALAVTEDGTVVVIAGVESNGLVALRDGKVAWRREGDFSGWLLPLSTVPATWVAAERDRLVAFDPGTGAERWSATLPTLVEGEGEWVEERTIEIKVAALDRRGPGPGLLVGDAEARFFHIDPSKCRAASTPGQCMVLESQLPNEELDGDARLFVDGGTRYLWEDDELRAFDEHWGRLMTARAHDSLSHVTVTDDRLVLVVDEGVAVLDPTACRSEPTFAPAERPRAMYGEDGCPSCARPPAGCRSSWVTANDLDRTAPALLGDGAVVVHADGYTLALDGRVTRWKATTGGTGPLVTNGNRVFGFSTELREGDPPGLFEVATTDGNLRWRTPLPAEAGTPYGNELRMAQAGSWLAAAYEQTIVVLPLPPA